MTFTKKQYHHEENCLNCNYPLIGKYCAQCGQKAFLHKDSFWHMAIHFVGDYFHYNNKFWITLKTLISKPGLTTIEYNNGKRVKFLNPIQLYIFVTTIFFLLTFSFSKPTTNAKITTLDSIKNVEKLNSNVAPDSLGKSKDIFRIENNNQPKHSFGFGNNTPNEANLHAYDSAQHLLPAHERDGFISQKFIRRGYYLQEKYEGDKNMNDKFLDIFFHNMPKVFFVLLPYFAFLLWLFFRKRRLYYVDHLIFSLHFHSFVFLLLTMHLLIKKILSSFNFNGWLLFIVFISIGFYLFLALKKVYGGSSFLLFFKQILLFFAYILFFTFTSIISLVIIFFMI